MEESKLLKYLEKYQQLEERFLELTNYIPLVLDLNAPNYNFPCPKAAEFGLDCATWLETLMTELLNDPRLDSFPGIEKLRSNPNIHAYRETFTKKFGFAKGGWKLKGFDGEEIWPFQSWEFDENPEWFRIYSKEKHDRIALEAKWTMKHSLMAFTALTIVLQHWKKPESWKKRESKILEGVIY